MNTRNNKRFINSQEAIEKAFIDLLVTHKTKKITVQAICNLANLNRTTFYAHYTDINDLQNKIEEKLSTQIKEIFEETLHEEKNIIYAFCEMFRFIKKHIVFYKVFLEYHNISILKTILNDTDWNMCNKDAFNYHISFFTAGVSEMIRIWLKNNCQEEPEYLAQIIYEEYCRR